MVSGHGRPWKGFGLHRHVSIRPRRPGGSRAGPPTAGPRLEPGRGTPPPAPFPVPVPVMAVLVALLAAVAVVVIFGHDALGWFAWVLLAGTPVVLLAVIIAQLDDKALRGPPLRRPGEPGARRRGVSEGD